MKNIYYRTRNKVRHTNKIVRKNGKHILDKNKTIREGLKEKKNSGIFHLASDNPPLSGKKN